MELRRRAAKRRVQLGREHEDGERGGEADPAAVETDADLDRHDRRAERRRELEHERREERDPQRRHRLAPIALAGLGQQVGLRGTAVERAQRGQAAHDVEEVRREARERAVAGARPLLGRPADEDPEDRDQRDGRRHHDGGGDVERHDPEEDRHGHDGAASTSCGR